MVTGLFRGSINIMEQGKDRRWVLFGNWYQKERKDRKKTQEEVSAIADISRQHLSDLENGNTGVKRDTVMRLADAIGVDSDEALRRAGFASTEMLRAIVDDGPIRDGENLSGVIDPALAAEMAAIAQDLQTLNERVSRISKRLIDSPTKMDQN